MSAASVCVCVCVYQIILKLLQLALNKPALVPCLVLNQWLSQLCLDIAVGPWGSNFTSLNFICKMDMETSQVSSVSSAQSLSRV